VIPRGKALDFSGAAANGATGAAAVA